MYFRLNLKEFSMECYFGQKSGFIFMMNSRDFIITVVISRQTVEVFMMNSRDFHDERSRFS